MIRSVEIIFFLSLLSVPPFGSCGEHELKYAPSPPDNPLMGLAPYVSSEAGDRFPHSLEFCYFALSDLMKGPSEYDWSPLEDTLKITDGRGCQLVTRIFLEYPGKKGIPRFLLDGGLKVTEWKSSDGVNLTPDYEDETLRRALRDFISAFGAKYDREPRLGYVTAGLLGSWGEWHNYPRMKLFASRAVQSEILTAYAGAFTHTPVLLRYPAGDDHSTYAKNVNLPFGYHDDSFSWSTLDTGKKEDSWFFLPLLKEAGALEKWKTQPIGGEIRPELWKDIFTDSPHRKQQDFSESVRQTHATWLMDSGMFTKRFPLSPERKARAVSEVSKMGYSFHVPKWKSTPEGRIEITVENRGVAPFYRDWPVILATFEENNTEIWREKLPFSLKEILPGESKIWSATPPEKKENQEYRIAVPNPMKNGRPMKFANGSQGEFWLVLKD